jgi:hypothetical protein
MTDTEAVRWALPVTATLTERNCNRQGFSGGEAANRLTIYARTTRPRCGGQPRWVRLPESLHNPRLIVPITASRRLPSM